MGAPQWFRMVYFMGNPNLKWFLRKLPFESGSLSIHLRKKSGVPALEPKGWPPMAVFRGDLRDQSPIGKHNFQLLFDIMNICESSMSMILGRYPIFTRPYLSIISILIYWCGDWIVSFVVVVVVAVVAAWVSAFRLIPKLISHSGATGGMSLASRRFHVVYFWNLYSIDGKHPIN